MVKDFNKQFNALKDMTSEEFWTLVKQRRLWTTRALMNQLTARIAMGPAPTGYHYPAGSQYYQGYIVTSTSLDLEEAKKLARLRGFQEEVVWLVEDSLPLGDHPMRIFKN